MFVLELADGVKPPENIADDVADARGADTEEPAASAPAYDEDDDLQRALQASLAEQNGELPGNTAGLSAPAPSGSNVSVRTGALQLSLTCRHPLADAAPDSLTRTRRKSRMHTSMPSRPNAIVCATMPKRRTTDLLASSLIYHRVVGGAAGAGAFRMLRTTRSRFCASSAVDGTRARTTSVWVCLQRNCLCIARPSCTRLHRHFSTTMKSR